MSGEENETGWYAELDKADQLRHIWRTDDEGEAELVAVIIGDSDDDYDPVPAQRARLIAAAPDLLEALEEFSREYDGFEDGNGDPCPVLAKARAAIAKARQSTPAPDCDGEGG